MKVIVVYLVAWPCFWLGHLISYPIHYWDWAGRFYSVYNTLMGWSNSIDRWAGGNRIWTPEASQEDREMLRKIQESPEFTLEAAYKSFVTDHEPK